MIDQHAPYLSIRHFSFCRWDNPTLWIQYLEGVQSIIGAKLTHLDDKDPLRRKITGENLHAEGEFVVARKTNERTRWVFGEIKTLKMGFTIIHRKEASAGANSIGWCIPTSFLADSTRLEQIRRLFDFGNATLGGFYSFADSSEQTIRKKKKSGAVDIQTELAGVFWLTYFGRHYVDFFGRDKLLGLQGVDVSFAEGATLRLGETPSAVPEGLRTRLEVDLGRMSFVDPTYLLLKRPGVHALTFDKLLN